MSELSVSIVIPTYNRHPLTKRVLESIFLQNHPAEVIVVDDGSTDTTPQLAHEFPIKYIRLERRTQAWMNPTYPNNVGVRVATGDILILNSGDVRHLGIDTITELTKPIIENPKAWTFATVVAETSPDSTDLVELVSPGAPRPFWFLCALKRQCIFDINGFDEEYTRAGYDDNDVADRLIKGLKLTPVYLETATALHQWHASPAPNEYAEMRALYNQKTADWNAGKINHIRNIGRDWGKIDGK